MQYLNIFDSLNQCLTGQGSWDPYNPQTPIARSILNAVRAEREAQKLDGTLGIFRAVGTVADYFHSVDCFIMTEDDRVALVDLTLNDRKTHCKNPAGLFIHPDEVDRDSLLVTASRVVDILKSSPFFLKGGTKRYFDHRMKEAEKSPIPEWVKAWSDGPYRSSKFNHKQ